MYISIRYAQTNKSVNHKSGMSFLYVSTIAMGLQCLDHCSATGFMPGTFGGCAQHNSDTCMP